MTIGISGASGPLARATAELALKYVDPGQVVLTTRTPDALGELGRRGVRVRLADFDDPASVVTALEGVDRLLLVSTDRVGARLDQHRAAVEAAAQAGVEHVIYTSVPEPTPGNPAAVVDDHAGTEQSLRDSGLHWTMLRNNLYAHLQLAAIGQAAATGRLVTNYGVGAAAYVTREDCAAVAAVVLTHDGYADKTFDVTGPVAVSAQDLAALAGEIGGREVEVVNVEDANLAGGLREAGLPEHAVELVTSFGAAARAGYLSHVSDTVDRVTGRAPTPFAEVVRRSLAFTDRGGDA